MKLTGIILCGGKSSRMGEDKGLIKYNNKHLIEYPLAILKELTSEIYLSTSNPEYMAFGYPLISDKINGIGPIGGIYSTLLNLHTTDYFFISCDTPNVSIKIANQILDQAPKYEIVVPQTSDNHIHPLFGYYSFEILGSIQKQLENNNYKMLDLLRRCNTFYLPVSEKQSKSGLFHNINTKKDVI